MSSTKAPAHIQMVSIFLASLAVLTIALGIYMTGPRLVKYATEYVSSNKVLSQESTEWLYTIRVKIFAVGLLLALASILAKLTGPHVASALLRGEALLRRKVRECLELLISLLGRGAEWVCRLAATEAAMWCFVLMIVVTLSIPAIVISPAGGFHVEGIDLQPAKNLVRHGIYGTLTTRGFDDLTHRSSVGPGIILPNALLFKVFGISAYVSRALHVAYVIGNLLVFYATARKLYGRKVAVVGMYIFTPTVLMLSRGASAMGPEGYTAAIFYTLAGALLWFRAIEAQSNVCLILSGLLWGLAFQTKWLFLFALFALVVTCALLRFSENSLGAKFWLVPSSMVGAVTLAWVVFRVVDVGLRQEIVHLRLFWAEHMHRAIGFVAGEGRPWEIIRPLVTLTQTDFSRVDLWGDLQFFLIIPALLYACIIVGRSGLSDYRLLYWLSFALIWFTWWFLFNFDLAEAHLLTFVQVSQLFIAKLFVDLWEFSLARKESFLGLIKYPDARQATMGYLIRVALACIVMGKVFIPLSEKAGASYTRNVTLTIPQKKMMAYIRQNTEQNAVFSGWDWSLPYYVDLDENGDHIVKDRATYPPEQREAVPEYFIVSPEWPLVKVTDEWPSVAGDSLGVENGRRKKFVEQHCTFVNSFGGPKHTWLLYRVNDAAMGAEPRTGHRS
jgi:hypothetical protein